MKLTKIKLPTFPYHTFEKAGKNKHRLITQRKGAKKTSSEDELRKIAYFFRAVLTSSVLTFLLYWNESFCPKIILS